VLYRVESITAEHSGLLPLPIVMKRLLKIKEKALKPSKLSPNNAADIHQLGPNNIYSHTTKLTTPMYFN
jgi:hypothetical protein